MKLEARNFKLRCCWTEANVECLHGVVCSEAKAFDGAVRHVEERGEIWIVTIAEQKAIARDEADEVRESFFDCVQVFKNIRVIKFEVVDDRDFRLVMNELAAFVEECSVVFEI